MRVQSAYHNSAECDFDENTSTFSFKVVNAAVEYAYGGIEEMSPNVAVRLYLLAQNLQSTALVDDCTNYLCARIEETNISEIWSAANATKNEVLIGLCSPRVAMNWELFGASRLFLVNTEIVGMMSLLRRPQMAQVPGPSKVRSLLKWRSSSRNDAEREARTNAFRDIIPLLGTQNSRELFADLYVEGVYIPEEWRRWLGEYSKSTKEQAIASSSLSSSSTQSRRTTASQERLAVLDTVRGDTVVRVFNAECSEVETEIELPGRQCARVIPFQNQLVFIGGLLKIADNHGSHVSNRVDSVDPSTGQVSPLANMMKARLEPTCVATENEIFVFSDWFDSSGASFSSEFYDVAIGRWSLLPPIKENKRYCAAVKIPDSGILIIGGMGSRDNWLRSTVLLTRYSSSRRGKKWQWRPFPPMNEIHQYPFAVYFQERVYVVGWLEELNAMEILDVAGSRQWTTFTNFYRFPFPLPQVCSLTRVDNQLFIQESSSVYSIELESEPNTSFWKAGLDSFLSLLWPSTSSSLPKLQQWVNIPHVGIFWRLTTVNLER